MKKNFLLIPLIIVILIIFILFIKNIMGGTLLPSNSSELSEGIEKIHNKSLDNYYSHVVMEEKNNETGVTVKIIYTIDDNQKCVSQRVVYYFEDTDEANNQFENWRKVSETGNDICNLERIDEHEIHFNSNSQIGNTKEELLKNVNALYY